MAFACANTCIASVIAHRSGTMMLASAKFIARQESATSREFVICNVETAPGPSTYSLAQCNCDRQLRTNASYRTRFPRQTWCKGCGNGESCYWREASGRGRVGHCDGGRECHDQRNGCGSKGTVFVTELRVRQRLLRGSHATDNRQAMQDELRQAMQGELRNGRKDELHREDCNGQKALCT
eukprot:5036496-Pleurochrysis_carterae.AAC.2